MNFVKIVAVKIVIIVYGHVRLHQVNQAFSDFNTNDMHTHTTTLLNLFVI